MNKPTSDKELLNFVNDFVDRDTAYREIIVPIITKRTATFYNANKEDFIGYIDIQGEPIKLELTNLECIGEHATLQEIINGYFYEELYDIYFKEINELEKDKVSKLILKFINENQDIKPYFNMDFDIYDTAYSKGSSIETEVTSLIVENFLSSFSIDFFKYNFNKLTLVFNSGC